jgi:hypothetical protein
LFYNIFIARYGNRQECDKRCKISVLPLAKAINIGRSLKIIPNFFSASFRRVLPSSVVLLAHLFYKVFLYFISFFYATHYFCKDDNRGSGARWGHSRQDKGWEDFRRLPIDIFSALSYQNKNVLFWHDA